MSLFARVRDALARFMSGRYGTDSLNRSLILIWLLLAIVNVFFHSLVIYVIELVFCFVVFFRMLSRNYVKRQRENAAWFSMTSGLRGAFRRFMIRRRDGKKFHFFKCPNCKAPIRMPRKVGRFNIRCNKCGHSFQKEFKK